MQEHVSQVPLLQIVPIKYELAHNTNMSQHQQPPRIELKLQQPEQAAIQTNSETLFNLHH